MLAFHLADGDTQEEVRKILITIVIEQKHLPIDGLKNISGIDMILFGILMVTLYDNI